MFGPGSTSPNLLEATLTTTLQDYHLLWSVFPDGSSRLSTDPRSLGATDGVAVAFLSSRY